MKKLKCLLARLLVSLGLVKVEKCKAAKLCVVPAKKSSKRAKK